MTTVVKLGGSVLDPEPSDPLARALARRALAGERLCVIHGGGKALTALLARLGIPTRFHRGLRHTDRETLAAATMVLAGGVNKQLVAALNRALALEAQPAPAGGAAARPAGAVGLCGVDGNCLQAAVAEPELGYVGEMTGGDPRLLATLMAAGFIPVLASIAAAADAPALNVNADSFAAACAVQLGADRLLFLTDVPGVLDAAAQTIPTLDLAELEALGDKGVASAGMLPKLAACRAALAGGVAHVEIAGAAEWLNDGAGAGRTRILAGERPAVCEPVP